MKMNKAQKQLLQRTFNGELGVISEESRNGILFTLNVLKIKISFQNGNLRIEDDME